MQKGAKDIGREGQRDRETQEQTDGRTNIAYSWIIVSWWVARRSNLGNKRHDWRYSDDMIYVEKMITDVWAVITPHRYLGTPNTAR